MSGHVGRTRRIVSRRAQPAERSRRGLRREPTARIERPDSPSADAPIHGRPRDRGVPRTPATPSAVARTARARSQPVSRGLFVAPGRSRSWPSPLAAIAIACARRSATSARGRQAPRAKRMPRWRRRRRASRSSRNELREAQAKLALLEARLSESQIAAGVARSAVPRARAVARRAGAERGRAGAAAREPAARASPATCRRRSPRCSSPKPSSPASIVRSSFRCAARWRATSTSLKAVPYVDVAGMSLKLDQALSVIDTLPLARDERLPRAAGLGAARRRGPRGARSCARRGPR